MSKEKVHWDEAIMVGLFMAAMVLTFVIAWFTR